MMDLDTMYFGGLYFTIKLKLPLQIALVTYMSEYILHSADTIIWDDIVFVFYAENWKSQLTLYEGIFFQLKFALP